jgi:ribA/ribD-fused uncharacterized protein
MHRCCLAKFTQHENLKKLLLDTGDAELQEDSQDDFFWGIGADGSGKNVLGKILMRIRDEIKSNSTKKTTTTEELLNIQ